jgi:hypothetical protein
MNLMGQFSGAPDIGALKSVFRTSNDSVLVPLGPRGHFRFVGALWPFGRFTLVRAQLNMCAMASEDEGYVLDADGNRILIGLTLVETREFERLDELILSLSSATTEANRSRNERRWLMLYDRHEAAVRIYLSTENAKALSVLRTERASNAISLYIADSS